MVVAIALFVVSALLVAPAAARGVGSPLNVTQGDTIYVGEKGLNFTAYPPWDALPGDFTFLGKYDGTTLVNTIDITTPGSFDLLPGQVAGEEGQYVLHNASGSVQIANVTQYVMIRAPSAVLDVRIGDVNAGDSIDGRSISRNTDNLYFRVTNNLGNLYDHNLSYKVEVTTPAGGTIREINGVNTDVIINKSRAHQALYINLAGLPAGTYTAIAKPLEPQIDDFANTNTVTFTITTKALTLGANVDTIVRNNNFLLTVTGESTTDYYLYVQSATQDGKVPWIRPGQSGVTIDANQAFIDLDGATGFTQASVINGTFATVRTNAAGTRNVEFATNETTEDKTYTFRVVDPNAITSTYDTVRVKIEKGTVSITASGDRTYYIGEEITFSGVNTDSQKVFLFMTGPNLPRNGVNFTDFENVVTAGTFVEVDVEADDTWELKVDTQTEMNVDAGTYTIYAVTTESNRDQLSGATYATTSIVLRKGFVSSSVSSATVAKGDSLFVRGNAQGNPDNVAIWVIGRNYFNRFLETVEDDSSFEYELKVGDEDLASGQYFVIVQHPMGDGAFGVGRAGDVPTVAANRVGIAGTSGEGTNGFFFTGPNRLQGSDAAQALIDLLNNQNIDDTYNRLTFLVEEPWIRIDTVSDKYVGTTFTVTGTTNLGVGNELMIEVLSSAFRPTDKTAAGEFSGDSGTVRVVEGDAGYNTWSFEVDARAFLPDEYIVRAESIDADITATTTFNVLEGAPVTTPPVTTPPVTTPPVTTPPVTPPPEPPETPGFGALIAIAGLGAVAFLVLRRN